MNAPPVLGILAGMGPSSTGPFVDQVYAACRRLYGARDDGDFPKLVICSQPAPFFHDRPIDHDAVCAATIDGLRTLERSGATRIAVACNSVHLYAERLAAAVGVPLLDIVETALDALPPGAQRVAFCTSRPLTDSGLYPQRALRRGLRTIAEQSPPWQPQVDRLQDRVHDGAGAADCAPLWQALFDEVLAVEPAPEALVVACLDLSAVVGAARSPLPLVDAAAALAERLVRQWLADRAAGTAGTA